MCIIHGRMNDGVNQIRISQCRFIKIDFIDFWALDCDTIAPWAVFFSSLLFGQYGNWLVRQKESLCFDHSSSDWINWMSVSSIGFLFHCFFIVLDFHYPFFSPFHVDEKKFIHIFLEFPIDFKQSKAYFMIQCHFYGHSLFYLLSFLFMFSFYLFMPYFEINKSIQMRLSNFDPTTPQVWQTASVKCWSMCKKIRWRLRLDSSPYTRYIKTIRFFKNLLLFIELNWRKKH